MTTYFPKRPAVYLSKGILMTASNLIGPLVQTRDRFIIAGVATAAVVAYYTVPSEMMLRLLIIPGALASALFPKLASELAWSGHEGRLLYRKSVKIIVLDRKSTRLNSSH